MSERRLGKTAKCGISRRTPVVVKRIRKSCDAELESPEESHPFGEEHKFFNAFTYKPSMTFDILVAVTIAVELYLYIKYGVVLKDPAASEMLNFNLLNIFFCVVGRFGWGLAQNYLVPFNFFELRNKSLKLKNKPRSEDRFGGLDAFLALIMFLIITFTQLIRFAKLNVSALDQFLFYVFAAPAEESFFRFFLVSAIIVVTAELIKLIMKRGVKKWEEIVLKSTSGFIVGLIFGFAHSARYTDMDLLVIILNGIEFSVMYAFIRRIDIVLLAHVGLNVRAGFEVFL